MAHKILISILCLTIQSNWRPIEAAPTSTVATSDTEAHTEVHHKNGVGDSRPKAFIPPGGTLKIVVPLSGTSQVLRCLTDGYPVVPEIEWLHNGKPITGDDHVIQHIHGNHQLESVLTIPIRTESDLGSYTCVAFNNAGSDRLTFDVTTESISGHVIESISGFIHLLFGRNTSWLS